MQDDETTDPAGDPAHDAALDRELNYQFRRVFDRAIQFALEMDGAPERCRRRACRASGECHVRMRGEEMPDCGGGVSAENLRLGGQLAVFAAMTGVRPGMAGEALFEPDDQSSVLGTRR